MAGGGDLSRARWPLMQRRHAKARFYFPLRDPGRPEYNSGGRSHPTTLSNGRNHAQVEQQRSGSRSPMADRKELTVPVMVRRCLYEQYFGSTGPDEASQYRQNAVKMLRPADWARAGNGTRDGSAPRLFVGDHPNSLMRRFAAFRSAVSNPSENRSYTATKTCLALPGS